jgi:hypothetical protein
MDSEVLSIFGLTAAQLAAVAAVALMVVEAAKVAWPTVIEGWKATALAFVASLGTGAYMVYAGTLDWPKAIALAVFGVIGSSAGKSLVKKVGTGIISKINNGTGV